MGELFYLKDGSLVNVSRGTKGDQGDVGPQGPPGPVVPLDDLTDVNAPNPTDRQFLSWDEPTQRWVARTSLSSLGIVSFQYTFGVATDATPNAGHVHANANPVGDATLLYIHKENRDGEDVTLFLENITAGCWINMFDYDLSSRFVAYDVTGPPTLVGDVFHVPITLFDGEGPPLTNNTRVSLFIRYVTQTGGAGSDGYTYMQDTTPEGASDGQTWFDTSTGNTFVFYEDADSSQWVMDNGGGSGGGDGGTPSAMFAKTVAIPFVDNAGNGQGNPGIGNPVAGRATFSAPGVYTIGARLRIASSFSVTGSAIALSNNGGAIQSQAAHGAFAQPGAYFLYTHLPDTADVSLGVQYFNIQGSDATISGAEITVMRVADIVW